MRRVLASAGGAALVAAVALFLLYSGSDGIRLEMDRSTPGFARGLYGPEREGPITYAWTSGRLVLALGGLDRSVSWTCTLRVRGARDATLPMPSILLSAGSIEQPPVLLSNDYQDLAIEVPPAEGAGLSLVAEIGPTFVPGGNDRRELGAQVDWVRCAPGGRASPPAGALRAAVLGAAAIGLVVGIATSSVGLIASTAAVAGIGLAVLIATGYGAFAPYPSLLLRLAIAASLVFGAALLVMRAIARRPPSIPAVSAVTATVVLGLLELAALAHPGKTLVDAVFQAHRLQSVIAGHYFFTQPLPDGVAFPYAIGLYVTALPLAGMVTDHVLLLRIVVIVATALAGALLYPIIARRFDVPAAGVAAVVLFHLVPLPYIVIGNANLTNAFAQAVALAAIASIAFVPLRLRSTRGAIALVVVTALTTTAFLSHVSTVALLAAAMGMIAVVLFIGERRSRVLSVALAGVIVVSGLLAVGLYYRHFGEVYDRAIERVFNPSAGGREVPNAPAPAAENAPAVLVRQLTWTERATDTLQQTTTQIGWPVLALAVIGATTVFARPRDRVSLFVVAWGLAWLLSLFGGTMTRVDTEYQRYAAEFIGRVNLAYYPVAALLAGLGSVRLWRAGIVGRGVAVLLVTAAAWIGTGAWFAWIR
jgi:hypothetical protein